MIDKQAMGRKLLLNRTLKAFVLKRKYINHCKSERCFLLKVNSLKVSGKI